jgi:hypothetical protein
LEDYPCTDKFALCPSGKLHIDCELLTAYYCNGDFEVQENVVVIYDVSLGEASLL